MGCTWGGAGGASVPSPFCRRAVGGSPALTTLLIECVVEGADDPVLVFKVLFDSRCT